MEYGGGKRSFKFDHCMPKVLFLSQLSLDHCMYKGSFSSQLSFDHRIHKVLFPSEFCLCACYNKMGIKARTSCLLPPW